QLAQHAPDDLVLRTRVAGNLDDRNPRDVDIVLDVGGAGLEIDRRGVDAALEVSELQVVLVLVKFLKRLKVGVADFVGVDRTGLQRQRRKNQRRGQQRIAADDDLLDDEALLDDQGQDAVFRIEIEILDVRGNL